MFVQRSGRDIEVQRAGHITTLANSARSGNIWAKSKIWRNHAVPCCMRNEYRVTTKTSEAGDVEISPPPIH